METTHFELKPAMIFVNYHLWSPDMTFSFFSPGGRHDRAFHNLLFQAIKVRCCYLQLGFLIVGIEAQFKMFSTKLIFPYSN